MASRKSGNVNQFFAGETKKSPEEDRRDRLAKITREIIPLIETQDKLFEEWKKIDDRIKMLTDLCFKFDDEKSCGASGCEWAGSCRVPQSLASDELRTRSAFHNYSTDLAKEYEAKKYMDYYPGIPLPRHAYARK